MGEEDELAIDTGGQAAHFCDAAFYLFYMSDLSYIEDRNFYLAYLMRHILLSLFSLFCLFLNKGLPSSAYS